MRVTVADTGINICLFVICFYFNKSLLDLI